MSVDRRGLMLIGGRPVDTEDEYLIVDPATQEVVGTAARGTREHVDLAVAAALEAHRRGEWRRRPPEDRATTLDRWVALLNENVDELVELHVRENGSPVRTSFGFHVGYSIAHQQYFADLARRYPFVESGRP